MAKVLRLKLEDEGFRVAHVGNGADGIQEMEKTHYDAVLLDLIMPELDGFGVLEKVKHSKKIGKQHIVVLTNLSSDDDVQRAKKLGAQDVLVKSESSMQAIVDYLKKNI